MIQTKKKITTWLATVLTTETSKKLILYIGLIIGIATYLFWEDLKNLGFKVFYIGNAIFIFSLCLYLFLTDTKSFIKYILFCLSLNNLCDELFFDPTKMGMNEIFIALTVLIFAIIRNKNAKRP
jgi:hypothetical protein